MRVISKKPLRLFWERHTDAEQPLMAWYNEVKTEEWKTPADVKLKYGSASILSGNRVVFNIKGNRYRLVVMVNYSYRIVYVRYIGTHEQYADIDAERI